MALDGAMKIAGMFDFLSMQEKSGKAINADDNNEKNNNLTV